MGVGRPYGVCLYYQGDNSMSENDVCYLGIYITGHQEPINVSQVCSLDKAEVF